MGVLVQIIGIVAPLIQEIIQDHVNSTGTQPTPEQIVARFEANFDKYLAEGAEWRSKHPRS